MNSLQLEIILTIIILIGIIIAYYKYKEVKFKNDINNKFNVNSFDINSIDNKIVLDSDEEISISNNKKIIQTDIAKNNSTNNDTINNYNSTQKMHDINNDLFSDFNDNSDNNSIDILDSDTLRPNQSASTSIPSDSLEAIFKNYDSLNFPYKNKINSDLDYVIDIIFDEANKLKFTRQIGLFTQNNFTIYILDNNEQWHLYAKNSKHNHKGNTKAIKIVIELISEQNLINNIQIQNIYHDLFNYTIANNAHIRQSEYEEQIIKLTKLIHHLEKNSLSINLLLLTENKLSYNTLLDFMLGQNLLEEQGSFVYKKDKITLFSIYHPQKFISNEYYNNFIINSNLHLTKNPQETIDYIFDFIEVFTSTFNARLLTNNKQLFNNLDYDKLQRVITKYMTELQKNNLYVTTEFLYRL